MCLYHFILMSLLLQVVLTLDGLSTNFDLTEPIRFIEDGIMTVGANNHSRFERIDISRVFRGDIRKVRGSYPDLL